MASSGVASGAQWVRRRAAGMRRKRESTGRRKRIGEELEMRKW